ncbi:hypothetical protein BVC80_1821g94 [Macleaya cordata]|uniref:Uncharacterized protein n=1 Tax=Macleaya cordata TaxID=56857 RepID=A0A200QZK8_MACCD|nr:hypothetical protein BVC80_1821g94 [Macleaya cordata]
MVDMINDYSTAKSPLNPSESGDSLSFTVRQMAWRCGSLSRSLLSTARSSSLRSSPPLPRLRPPPTTSPRHAQSRHFSFANPRTLGELACTQSLLPLHCAVAASRLTSHLTVNSRAFFELSQGMEMMVDTRLAPAIIRMPQWNKDDAL